MHSNEYPFAFIAESSISIIKNHKKGNLKMRNVKLSIILTISILYGVVARAVSQSLDPTTPYYQKIVSQGFAV